jgi:hypothetical protein
VLRVEKASNRPPAKAGELRIVQPKPEQVLSLADAAELEVDLALSDWTFDDGDVDLSLDAYGPRSLKSLRRPLRIVDLVPEDQELRAGEHVLFAVLVQPDGSTVKHRSLAAGKVRFWIGQAAEPSLDLEAPLLLFGRPRGTYNGERAAARVLLDFYLYNVDLSNAGPTVRARVRGPRSAQWIIADWRPFVLLDLPSGDYEVELELLTKAPEPKALTKAERAFVVNREIPEGALP